jgi:hypothetical protein
MQELDNKTDADFFLTKAFEEVWSQRLHALAPGQLGLLYKIERPTALCYALSNGRVVFAIPVEELADSYILALPAILVKGDGGVTGQPLVTEPAIRLFKSNLLFVTSSSQRHLSVYYSYIFGKKNLLQGLLTESAVSEIGDVANERMLSAAFSAAVNDEETDEDDDSDDSKSVDAPIGSTMPWYYNTRTKH